MRYLIILSLFLVACGDELETRDEKPLFRKWTSGSAVLDLSAAGYAPSALSIPLATNAGCNCTLEIIGDEQSGKAYIGACTHYGPTNYCWSGTREYDYTNMFGYLTVCRSGDCEVYE